MGRVLLLMITTYPPIFFSNLINNNIKACDKCDSVLHLRTLLPSSLTANSSTGVGYADFSGKDSLQNIARFLVLKSTFSDCLHFKTSSVATGA